MMAASARLDFTTLDVFTHTKYAGNPLAVVHVPSSIPLNFEQRHAITGEFNLSETVFVRNQKDGPDGPEFLINIHTTWREMSFAGHPTIGTACLLAPTIQRDAASGVDVRFTLVVPAGRISISYSPSERSARCGIPHDYRQHAASLPAAELSRTQPKIAQPPDHTPIVSIVKDMTFPLIELQTLDDLNFVDFFSSRPTGFELDKEWATAEAEAVYFFKRLEDSSDGTLNIRTRMMELEKPAEDPATGSAACTLSAYLALKEGKKGGTMRFNITQGVEMGRKSDIGVEVGLGSDGGLESVTLSGGAVEVMKGSLILPSGD